MIDDLRQILLDKYERIGLEGGYQDPLTPDHQCQTVGEGTSWEGGRPIQLPYIPLDSTIADNNRRYRNSAGIETDSVRNPPRPAKRSRIQSYIPTAYSAKAVSYLKVRKIYNWP
jgi:hypothetical protein